jgi:lipoprotein-anchoring transpeptidase ErfK/SrfK
MYPKRILVFFGLLLTLSISVSACFETPSPGATPTPESTVTALLQPTQAPSSTPFSPPTQTPLPTPTVFSEKYTVMAGDTLWGISLSSGVSVDNIVKANGLKIDDLIFPGQILYLPNPAETPQPQLETNKKIVVILSQQMAYAYEGEDLIMEFVVSTGVPDHPTVQGIYFIYIKLESTRMTGPGYDLPNVPWTMYFYKGYGFHGTYWHSNFGQPMSHGCVNMKTEEAEWLFRWAPIGTRVEIYP